MGFLMSIYDKKSKFDFDFLFDKNGKPGLGTIIIAIVVVLVLAFFAWSFLFARPLAYSFDKNTITASEQAILKVGVANPFSETATNVKIEVVPADKKSISVHDPVRTIETLDNYRELTFLVNPVGPVLPGNYEITITATINGQKFEENAVLTVKANN